MKKNISSDLKLTRSQVNAMASRGELDGNTNVAPTPKFAYDGTVEPGMRL